MTYEAAFFAGAIAFIVLAIYHMVGLPLARDIGFFLPIKVVIFFAPVIMVVGALHAMIGPEKTIYPGLALALAYSVLLWEGAHLFFKREKHK